MTFWQFCDNHAFVDIVALWLTACLIELVLTKIPRRK